jgi:hypothetical protein
MIKAGDKVLCIKDIFSVRTGNQRFHSGKWYEIVRCESFNSEDRFYLYPDDGDYACVVRLNAERIENFVTLAEWRDLQINKILEDD